MLLLNDKEYPTHAGLYYVLHRMYQRVFIGIANNLSIAFLDNNDKLCAGIHENRELQGYHDYHAEHLVFMYVQTPTVEDAVQFLKKLLCAKDEIVSLMNDEQQFKKLVTGLENPLHPKVEFVKTLTYFTESMMYGNEEHFNAINACLGLRVSHKGTVYPNIEEANIAVKAGIKVREEREFYDVVYEIGSQDVYWLDMDGAPYRYTIDRDFFKEVQLKQKE